MECSLLSLLSSTMCGSGKLQQAIQAAFERQYCETGRGAFAHALGVQKDGLLILFYKYNKEKKKKKKGEKEKCTAYGRRKR